jgi:signal transduction histidine kinase/ActR/RegA family two-component response regulator
LFLESVQAKAGFRDLEHRVGTRSGGAVWLSANGVPVLDATGELIGYRGTSRDITERKRAEEEMAKLETRLRQAQKLEAIGTLAGGIAHDFNNILTPIMGYTEMALGELPESSPMRYDLNQVLAAACRAKDLVKQILTFSRLNQDQFMRPVDISLVVKEALKLLRSSLPTTIEIRQNIQKGMVVADATQIHQVLVNLCTNAAHAMDERGVLGVSLVQVVLSDEDLPPLTLPDLKAGSYLQLSVRDTGHGMTGDIMEHIFEPYFTTKQVGEGTGLGLAVVHGIVKKHGGEIRVQSTPGVGSVFEVYLPLAAGEASQEVGPSQSVPRGTESILLVDDEPMITEMGGRLLGQLGYSVTAKNDPREAHALMLSNPDAFHLVITDYTMPYMTGVELAQGILKIKPGMPIVLCTGFNERMSAEMVHQAGIVELVIKPFDQKHLAELIRRVLEPHEASSVLLRSSP